MPARESAPRLPVAAKKEGLRYLTAPGGIEVPIIDLSHQAFALDPKDEELEAAMEATVAYVQRTLRMPRLIRKLAMGRALRGSRLAAAVASASSGYLGGLDTYLFKLGPDNLGPWAGPTDRAVASSFPCYSTRLRMRDAATLLAGELLRMARSSPAEELRLVGIAGGPAMDIVNALILARADSPGALEGRSIRIDVLDRDAEGPAFGRRALAELLAEGGTLAGLEVAMRGVPYDWDESGTMAEALALSAADSAVGDAAAAGGPARFAFSSEDGLFDYASDEAVWANLRAMGEIGGEGAAIVGTMSVAEGAARLVNGASGAALRLRSAAAFEGLVGESGWRIEGRIERPLARSFLLRRL